MVEEKCDGANSAISFGKDGELLLQSRGHYLTGGYRERHYNLLKQWASVHRDVFYQVLGRRYVMYGEWMYAKHSVYYDALPHYFLEFDILDRESGCFLDTPSRRKLTRQMPVVSVPVLREGGFRDQEELLSLIGPSLYIRPGHMDRLRAWCEKEGLDAERQCRETEGSGLMEGLYLKVEQNGCVTERLKYVRASFYAVYSCIGFPLAGPAHYTESAPDRDRSPVFAGASDGGVTEDGRMEKTSGSGADASGLEDRLERMVCVRTSYIFC